LHEFGASMINLPPDELAADILHAGKA
jgi:hypothetical protein